MSETSRRDFGKLMLALPAAGLAAAAGAEEKGSDLAEVLAAREPGLSDDERKRLQKAIGDSLKPLQVVRDFKLPEDAAPAFRFSPLRSTRS
jgi:hypothetical protein